MSTLSLILAEIEAHHAAPGRIDAAERIAALERALDLYTPENESDALALARMLARRSNSSVGRSLAAFFDARPMVTIAAPVASAAGGLVTALARDLEAAWRRHDAADRASVDLKTDAARAEMAAAETAVASLEWALAAAFPINDSEVSTKIRLAVADVDPMGIEGEAGERAGLSIRAIASYYESRDGDAVPLGKHYGSVLAVFPSERAATVAGLAGARLC